MEISTTAHLFGAQSTASTSSASERSSEIPGSSIQILGAELGHPNLRAPGWSGESLSGPPSPAHVWMAILGRGTWAETRRSPRFACAGMYGELGGCRQLAFWLPRALPTYDRGQDKRVHDLPCSRGRDPSTQHSRFEKLDDELPRWNSVGTP